MILRYYHITFSPLDPLDCVHIFLLLGTTGVPKGGMISHSNVVANVSGIIRGNLELFGTFLFSILELSACY